MRSHPLFCSFLMAFAFTWAYEVIAFGFVSLQNVGDPVSSLAVEVLTLVGPTLSTFIMTTFM